MEIVYGKPRKQHLHERHAGLIKPCEQRNEKGCSRLNTSEELRRCSQALKTDLTLPGTDSFKAVT